jgi:acetyl-CoA carboxylase beta subunit
MVCCLDLTFMMGSMGSVVVGELMTRSIEHATEGEPAADHRQLLGRRSHAGVGLSLMQMAKT